MLPSPPIPRPILRALSTATPWPKGGATDGGAKRYHHTSLTAFVPNDCDFGGSEGAEINAPYPIVRAMQHLLGAFL